MWDLMLHLINRIVLAGTILTAAIAAQAAKPTAGNFVAESESFQLDPKLPEPFARSKTIQVYVNFDYKDVSLVFGISEKEGIEVTFPIVKDSTDTCNIREIIAAPPEGSTPYYKDFEIKVIDYSENTCNSITAPAMTVATLKSYEVHYKTTTESKILAGAFKTAPSAD